MTATLDRGTDSSAPVYLEVAGEKWRVYDCSYANGRMRRLALPSSRANYRVFVSAVGWRKAYQFTRGENRQLTSTLLEGQLERSRFIKPFPPGYQAPDWRAANATPRAV